MPSPAASTALKTLADVIAAKPGAAPRAGQQEMAAAVADALADGETLLVEAGTGVGKSYGYLVPAVLAATGDLDLVHDDSEGERSSTVVVATATKALQEQLVDKDLPFLADVLAEAGREFTYAMLKGRSNYLCRARWEDKLGDVAVGTDTLSGPGGKTLLDPAQVQRLRDWVAETETGERSEVDVPDAAWRELSVGSEECPGRRACPFAGDCFVYAARDRAKDADVVVANTALYGAHLASGGHALPDHQAVIFDEAHTLENVMAEAFSVTFGPQRLRNLAYRLRRVVEGSAAFDALLAAADAYAWELGNLVGERVDPTHGPLGDTLQQAAEAVAVALTEVGGPAAADGDVPAGDSAARAAQARRSQVAQMAQSLGNEVDSLVEGLDGSVSWVEDGPGGPRLRRAPVDVGPQLATDLFARTRVVATSATLRVGGSFDALARRWGLLLPGDGGVRPEVRTVVASSPFAYRSQGYLYVAGHLPDPRSDSYPSAMREELARLASAANGRTLALFTSRSAMTAAVEHLRATTTLRVLAQGDASRATLLEEFTSGPGNVLCALASFWTGVDIAGPALSLVTIDKVPFPRRGEPLVDARRAAVARAGGNGFASVDIPAAATDLAQGAGRLIRSTDDRGVVALFDSRLLRKSYGRTLLGSLPPLYPTTDTAAVAAALARLVADLDDTSTRA